MNQGQDDFLLFICFLCVLLENTYIIENFAIYPILKFIIHCIDCIIFVFGFLALISQEKNIKYKYLSNQY